MKFGEDGRLWAINPEYGFFGVAPGTNSKTNLNAMLTLSGNSIFTNTALTDDGDVWWESMTDEPPAHLTDWRGQSWTPASGTPAAHPNARFTAPASQDPAIAPEWEEPSGVPISAILFGGRRSTRGSADHRGLRLATRRVHGLDHGLRDHRCRGRSGRQAAARSLRHAAFLRVQHGRLLRSLAEDRPGGRRRASCPKIFYVNWFRKSAEGRFLWPGFGENSRVLEWVFQRCAGRGESVDTRDRYPPGHGRHPCRGSGGGPGRHGRAPAGGHRRMAPGGPV